MAKPHSTDAGRVAASYGFRDVTAQRLSNVPADLTTADSSDIDHGTKARARREARPDTLINIRPSKNDMEMRHPRLVISTNAAYSTLTPYRRSTRCHSR